MKYAFKAFKIKQQGIKKPGNDYRALLFLNLSILTLQ